MILISTRWELFSFSAWNGLRMGLTWLDDWSLVARKEVVANYKQGECGAAYTIRTVFNNEDDDGEEESG